MDSLSVESGIPDSNHQRDFRFLEVNSRFAGFRIPQGKVFQIPDCTGKNYPDFRIQIALHGVIKEFSFFHVQVQDYKGACRKDNHLSENITFRFQKQSYQRKYSMWCFYVSVFKGGTKLLLFQFLGPVLKILILLHDNLRISNLLLFW